MSKIKNYSLVAGCLPRNKRWATKIDYEHKLSDQDKRWLNKFTQEFHEGRVDRKNALHDTVDLRRDCYNRNNAQNRDVFAIKSCCGKMVEDKDYLHSSDEESAFTDPEQAVIAKMYHQPIDLISSSLDCLLALAFLFSLD